MNTITCKSLQCKGVIGFIHLWVPLSPKVELSPPKIHAFCEIWPLYDNDLYHMIQHWAIKYLCQSTRDTLTKNLDPEYNSIPNTVQIRPIEPNATSSLIGCFPDLCIISDSASRRQIWTKNLAWTRLPLIK